jgi:hypothetical protein
MDPKESFIERWLIVPKLLYFILNMFVYAFHALLGFIFVDQWKFSYYLYGYATSIVACNFFGAMLWTSLADRTGRYKMIIIITSVLFTIVACGMGMYQPEDPSIMIKVFIFVGFGLFNFFLSAVFPLLDAQILSNLAANPKLSKEQFGIQRLFGAIGHFVATLVSLFVYDKHDPKGPVIFQLIVSIMFIIAVWFGVKDVTPIKGHGHHGADDKNKEKIHQVPLSQAMPMAPTPAPASAADELSAEGTAGVRHPIIALITNPNFMFFMLFVACSGVVRSVTSSFQKQVVGSVTSSFLKQSGSMEKRPDNKLIAAVDFARMISEIAIYLLAKPIKNMMGVYWILVLSQLVGIARLAGYGFLSIDYWLSYYLCWGLELLKGFSSGLISSSAIPIASRIAPPGCEGSAQGLFSGNYSGLSMALGGGIGGGILHLYDHYGSQDPISDCQWMFIWVSVGTLAVTMLMMLKFIFVDRVMGIPGFPRRSSMPT